MQDASVIFMQGLRRLGRVDGRVSGSQGLQGVVLLAPSQARHCQVVLSFDCQGLGVAVSAAAARLHFACLWLRAESTNRLAAWARKRT